MVTPTYMLFAVLAFLAMLAVLVAFVFLPEDTKEHFGIAVSLI